MQIDLGKIVLKFGGSSGICASIILLTGFIIGAYVGPYITGSVTSDGSPAGTLQTYGEPLEELLGRIAKDSAFHIASRVLIFTSSILAIFFIIALRQLIVERQSTYRLLSMIAFILGIGAMASFAISHVVLVPLSTDIAERYFEASTEHERINVLADAQRIDESIGITAFDNIFMGIGIPLLLASLLTYGVVMLKIDLFERWLGWSTVLFAALSLIAIVIGNATGRGGIEVIPATTLTLAWFILVGYRVDALSRNPLIS